MSSLALRSLRLRARATPSALTRSYATPAAVDFHLAEASGIKIASVDDGAPTGAISVIVKGGSRFETSPGLSHVLKNSLFKGTSKRSAIRLVRETEMFGGVLSSALSREHLILTAEFIRGDEAYFAEVLGDALTKAKFAPHEYNEEVIPQVAAEYEQAIRDPTTYALDMAHQLAFRHGLGNSLFASPHTAVDFKSATAFAHSALSTPSNLAVVSTGVDAGLLKSLVSDFFVAPSTSSSPLTSSASTYFGGEVRVPAVGHGSAVDHFLIAFKGADSHDVEYSVLRHLLGGEAAVKWSTGTSPLSKLGKGRSSAKAFNLGYSDAGLFGIFVTAPTADVQGLATQAIAELKRVAAGANAEEVKQAVAKAKFAAATALESRVGRLELVGGQIVNYGSAPSLESIFAQLDKVTAESVTKAAAAALKSRPTTVAIGNTQHLPYADSVGL